MTHTLPRLLATLLLSAIALPAWAEIPIYKVKIVNTYPHDTAAFTEGLFYLDGHLYESTGEQGESWVRKVELTTGKVLQQADLPSQYFGEGIVAHDGKLMQLTWRSGVGAVRDLKTFEITGSFRYSGEGWALTRDDQHLYMSDGTPTIRVLDPVSLMQMDSINVTSDGKPLQRINELEWIKGELWANVWMTDRIARIDPKTGKVIGWVDLKGMFDYHALPNPTDDVPNGIAYDAEHDRIFVTGKRWPKLFEIKLTGPH
ncbi:glutaminyl-peptide cyclotransferase [Pseudoxanthomonas sp.]|uniref:glutaminyl-peptide cyclotransferase n=1 Tax=Pseudoxanthomonas sp. TaxID=1871049 RepID=UPI0026350C71|nr:glutaminyl-peptide cyclotransferase [Pseudoxanthomonas sp.]WDS37863.1 MAG: glutaminyl-peptide cyclotransferase [Pseudoxanthomonas sp.]